jgi:hypothetical protein
MPRDMDNVRQKAIPPNAYDDIPFSGGQHDFIDALHDLVNKGFESDQIVKRLTKRFKVKAPFILEELRRFYGAETRVANLEDLESRIAHLEKQSSVTERDVIDAMNKFKSLYEAGFLDRATYETHWDRLQDQLADFRIEDEDIDDPSVPKVGDILYSSWGYGMTLVDFFKVIKVSPSGKSITLQELESNIVEGSGYDGYKMPSKHEDRRKSPIKNKRVSPSRDSYSVKINQSAYAYKWDGKKKYFNTLD